MSLIGRKSIKMPEGVSVKTDGGTFIVTGPKGSLKKELPRGIGIKSNNGFLTVSTKGKDKASGIMHGTYRSLVANMVAGVSLGWTKTLELVGTGYRAEVTGTDLVVQVGLSHPVRFKAPQDVSFKVEKNEITITGTDKAVVGQLASKIRMSRPPDPYKGKGVKFKDEIIRRKAGKAAKTAGAGPS